MSSLDPISCWASPDGFYNFAGRNQTNCFLQFGHHITQNLVGGEMRVADGDCMTIAPCDSYQFANLHPDETNFLLVVQKNVPLRKGNLKQTRGRFAKGLSGSSAIDKIKILFFQN